MYVLTNNSRRLGRYRARVGFWKELVSAIAGGSQAVAGGNPVRQKQEAEGKALGVTRECIRVRDARWNAGMNMVDLPTSAPGDMKCTANRVGWRPGDAAYPDAPVFLIAESSAEAGVDTNEQMRQWQAWLASRSAPAPAAGAKPGTPGTVSLASVFGDIPAPVLIGGGVVTLFSLVLALRNS